MTRILLSVALLLLALSQPVWGQRENSNWHFGNQAALNFPVSGSPTPSTGSAMTTYEACASVSDAAGQLQFYSNGETVWNRNNQVMANGTNLGGWVSATQGATIVQNPGNAQQYYLFVADGAANQGVLKYNLVDMARQSGLGEVTTRAMQVPAVGQLTEKLTSVPHANGRDTWVLVHGWQNNTFYAYLVTPSGVQTVPVTTSIGSVHGGGGYGNSVGYMRASPDGTRLAVAIRDYGYEVFDFNPATGQLANYIPLLGASRSYGVAFSPNGRRLYGTSLNFAEIYQFDLQAGSTTAISNSIQVVGSTSADVGSIQASPDGTKLYVAILGSPYLGVIQNPNVGGSGCGYQANAVYLGGATSQLGLPNYPGSLVRPSAITLTTTAATACVGTATTFAATLTPSTPGTVATWNFGDPASSSANTATGLSASHTYGQAGTYQATLTVMVPGLLTPLSAMQSVTVAPLPAPHLPLDTVTCSSPVVLRPRGNWPAGSTFSWQDGSTGTTFLAAANGTYSVQITSPQGCVATATTRVRLGTAPVVRLAADTLVCPTAVWTLRTNPQPVGTTYRWQDGSTGATYVARGPGQYAVEVRAPVTGCAATATLRASMANCPILIPNVITPNGDPQNEFFILKGLQPSDWHLSIFDRWGRQVYDRAQYDNGWNATGQSSGIYYYRLHNATTGERHQGWVEVVRVN
jgi:gliding motility-associated-like protein